MRVTKTNKAKLILSSKCAVCDSKRFRCIKEQETRRILITLGIKIPLSKFYC